MNGTVFVVSFWGRVILRRTDTECYCVCCEGLAEGSIDVKWYWMLLCLLRGSSGRPYIYTEIYCIFCEALAEGAIERKWYWSQEVWWPHWPEILCRIPSVKNACTLHRRCMFRYCIEYSATCDVLIFQVMYKLRITPVQCHVQNVCHWSQP